MSELVAEVAARMAALPAPRNGQVRAVPDERTIRYYVTLGLLDRPSAMRGRTALYGRRHAAQVVAIKRLQILGRSLSEIQALWPTLDDEALGRMSGVALPVTGAPPDEGARPEFWRRSPSAGELRVELAPRVTLLLSATGDRVAASPADVRAIRAAAAPLLAELASRQLVLNLEDANDCTSTRNCPDE